MEKRNILSIIFFFLCAYFRRWEWKQKWKSRKWRQFVMKQNCKFLIIKWRRMQDYNDYDGESGKQCSIKKKKNKNDELIKFLFITHNIISFTFFFPIMTFIFTKYGIKINLILLNQFCIFLSSLLHCTYFCSVIWYWHSIDCTIYRRKTIHI